MKLQNRLAKVIAIAIAAIIILLIIKPYFGVIAFAALLAYLLHPAYSWLSKRIDADGAAALLTCLSLSVVIFVISYGINIILNEFAKISLFISHLPIETLSPTVEDALRKFISATISQLSSLIYALPQLLLSFLFFFIAVFYFLREGEAIVNWIRSIMPFSEERSQVIFQQISKQADAFVHVQLAIGLVQGIVAALGFYLFGLPYSLIAGLTAGLLSILPIIGPYILYIPTSIISIIQGDSTAGIGILLYGLVIASFLDYVVRPHLISKSAKVHPLIIFIGIFGGIRLLGVAGIFIGPILLTISLIIFKELASRLSTNS